MVLEKGVPFKRTLHPDLCDSKHAMSIPVYMSCIVLDNGQEHCADLIVPSSSSILGFELRNIEFSFTSNSKPNVRLSAYLFVQLLDGQSRPTSHPFPVASCDALTWRGLSSSVILPLQGGQRVRFYLVQRNTNGDGRTGGDIRVDGLRFIGVINLSSGSVIHKNSKTKKQIDLLSQNILEFRTDKKRKEMTPSKRQREPGLGQEEGFIVAEKPCNALRKNTLMDENNDEPPNLIYAFVPGGDDES